MAEVVKNDDEARDWNEADQLEMALQDWWQTKALEEVTAVAPKAVEYSSVDLVWIGRTLGLILGRDGLDDEEATELGIFFYEVGKIGRWIGAIKEGRRPSDDTLFDAGIYIKMAQRNRDVGGWPFAKDDSE